MHASFANEVTVPSKARMTLRQTLQLPLVRLPESQPIEE
jgi:hypothetical protein